MKTITFSLSCILTFGFFLTSCEQSVFNPSGNIVEIQRDVSGFDRLAASDDFEVFINFSEENEGVRVEADENLIDHVAIEKDGETLRIELNRNFSFNNRITLRAYVTVQALSSIRGSGDVVIKLMDEMISPDVNIKLGGDSKLEGAIKADALDIDLSGDSQMELFNLLEAKLVTLDIASDSEFKGSFNTERMEAQLTGDSKVDLSGSANFANISASGDSQIEDFGFSIKQLDIRLKSDSDASFTVTELLDVRASGDSVFRYKGDPTINSQIVTGDSKVIKED